MNKPLLLIILDGFGIAEEYGNAIQAANKPNLDRIFIQNPIIQIQASSMSVGLPEGQMGNSEVGHTNIGAGRIVYQELTRITKSIQDGDFFENPALVQAVNNAKKNKKTLKTHKSIRAIRLYSLTSVPTVQEKLHALW